MHFHVSHHASTIEGLDISVHEIHSQLNASTTRISQIREETARYNTLAALRETIAVGWPQKRADCPEIIQGYWNYRDELGVEDVSGSELLGKPMSEVLE